MKKIIYIVLILAIVIVPLPYILKYYGRYRHKEPEFPAHNLPLEKSVNIYINEYQIPFIEAQTDRDAAFSLGMVHAHYRLPQIEISRLIAKGELSSVVGPMANDIDQTLRILQFGKAAQDMIRNYPPDTLTWLKGYLDGINHYITHAHPLPWDMKLLHIKPHLWTMEDLVTVFRMASSDVNWGYLFTFLGQAKNSEWSEMWNLYIHYSKGSIPSALEGVVGMQERGSNSLVIGGKKSASGSGMIASDPHVSIFLPNLWFLCGIKSPTYHAVGLTIPGTPFIAMGRNPDIAWGATNMYSLSSFLFELEPKDLTLTQTIEEKIPTRFGDDKTIKVRNSMYGPVISDSPLLEYHKDLALYWLGHQSSDEVSAFLRAGKAKNFDEFQKAFHTYGVLGLNYVFTDQKGNVGYVPAYRQPLTKTNDKKLIYKTNEFSPSIVDQNKLQRVYNPRRGFIASANNKPIETDRDWGWFYAPNDRFVRQNELIQSKEKVTVEDLKTLQLDVQSLSALSWIEWLKKNTTSIVHNHRLYKTLSQWNGDYDKNLIEPVIFELLKNELSATILRKKFNNTASIRQLEQTTFVDELIPEILISLALEERSKIIYTALEQIKSKVTSVKDWGQFHPMTLQYIFGYIPWIGKAFEIKTYPASGANDTLFKRAFVMTENSAAITYGSAARHISDLSDLDANYFVLFGAQNGYPFSKENANQLELWENSKYIQIPLRIETIKKQFKKKIVLEPLAN